MESVGGSRYDFVLQERARSRLEKFEWAVSD